MDKAFYESEIEALRKQLINAQEVAIHRGCALIKAQDEVRRLRAEAYDRKFHHGATAEVAAGSKEVTVDPRVYKDWMGI